MRADNHGEGGVVALMSLLNKSFEGPLFSRGKLLIAAACSARR